MVRLNGYQLAAGALVTGTAVVLNPLAALAQGTFDSTHTETRDVEETYNSNHTENRQVLERYVNESSHDGTQRNTNLNMNLGGANVPAAGYVGQEVVRGGVCEPQMVPDQIGFNLMGWVGFQRSRAGNMSDDAQTAFVACYMTHGHITALLTSNDADIRLSVAKGIVLNWSQAPGAPRLEVYQTLVPIVFMDDADDAESLIRQVVTHFLVSGHIDQNGLQPSTTAVPNPVSLPAGNGGGPITVTF